MKHARSGRILIQVAVIIAIGATLGLADAFVFRKIDLAPRAAPVDPDILIKGGLKPKGTTNHMLVPVEAPKPTGPTTPDDHAQPTQPPPVEHPTTPPTEPDKSFIPTSKADLPPGQITIDQAKAFYDADAKFVDSRQAEPYKLGHILNALRIDTGMFTKGDPPELGLIPRDSIVVVYCNGGHCDESENLAKLLTNSGYKSVYVLHDGYPGWKASGHPTAVGDN